MNTVERHAASRDAAGDEMEERKSRDLEQDAGAPPLEMWTGPVGMNTAEDEAGTARSVVGEEDEGEEKRISTIRIVALTIIMILTYFLGVSRLLPVLSWPPMLNIPLGGIFSSGHAERSRHGS